MIYHFFLADYIQNIFELLRQDLKDDENKELFLNYYGTWTILKFCKSSNKHFLGCSIETYLQLCVDWKQVNAFLDSCGNETWFAHIAGLLKNQTVLDLKCLEKLSVLLQKLSKIK